MPVPGRAGQFDLSTSSRTIQAPWVNCCGVAGTSSFEHNVAEIRQRFESDKAYEDAAASYTQQRYTVIEDYPDYYDTTHLSLRYLRTDDGASLVCISVQKPQPLI